MPHPKATSPPHQQDKLSSEYTLPTSGVLSHVPQTWVPYGELARVDRPTGILHFYFLHLFGTLYAACITSSATRLDELLYKNVVLFVGTFFFRSAACAWSDNLDREYDRQVPRCRLRPLARGALTPAQGHVFTIVPAMCAVYFIYLLPSNCWLISAPNFMLAIFYPLAKRVTDFPQAVLGVQQALGLFIGVEAIMANSEQFLGLGTTGDTTTGHLWGLGALYLAIVFWEVIVDTVYAQQDVEHDAQAGVRSMALHFRDNAKALLWAISLLQTMCLVATGVCAEFGPGYLTIACDGVISALGYMLGTIDLSDPRKCTWFFKTGHWYVNLAMAGGLFIESRIISTILSPVSSPATA